MTSTTYGGFTMARLLWNNLRARPLRTLLSVIALAIQVFLVLFIVGLTSGVVSEWGKRVEGVGADILVQQPGSSIFFAMSSPVLQESLGDRIAQLPGVDEVSPVLIMMDTRAFTVIYGIDYRSFNALSKGFLFLQGQPFEGPNDALVDDIFAESRRLKLGDKILALNTEFTVVGIVAHGKGARVFIPLRTAQDIGGAEKRVSMFYVRSKGDTDTTRADIVQLLPDYRIRTMAEYLTLMNSSNLPELRPFIRSFVGLGVAISFLVVLLTMHTMVLERTREIGILKALGASKRDILGLILGETMLMTAVGAVVGVVSTYGLRAILQYTAPSLTVLIPEEWVLWAVVFAVIGAMAGALYPALRAARFDPVDALAYE